jgi:hypothetical protein
VPDPDHTHAQTPMTPESRRLVQESWRQVVPIAETAMRLFYYRLFELDPLLGQAIGPADLARCHARLMQVLNSLVIALAWRDGGGHAPGPASGSHDAAALRQAHVLDALLWMLERRLGHRFTPGVREAWAEAVRPHLPGLTRAALGGTAGTGVNPHLRHIRGLVPVGS